MTLFIIFEFWLEVMEVMNDFRLISISRSVGTFARALDKPSIAKMGLVDAASLASRDVTLLWAYHIIHKGTYGSQLRSIIF